MTKKIIQILETTDYDQFVFLKENRQIKQGTVLQLTKKILRNNLLWCNPIQVNERLEVVDGQHRLVVAKTNKLPIYYIVCDGLTIKDVRDLNEARLNWSARTYVDSFAAEGKPDYLWLSEFMSNNGISLSVAVLFVFGSYAASSMQRQAIRNGILSILGSFRIAGEKRVKFYQKIRPFMDFKGFPPVRFMEELVAHFDKNGEALFLGLQEKGQTFIPKRSETEARAQLIALAK